MNKHNLPWVRGWSEEPAEEAKTSFWVNVLIAFAFVAASWGTALIVAEGLDRSAVIAQKEAKAKQLGRIEMLQEVGEAFEKEGKTLETYYRWASKKGTTGFDGVVLADGRQ